jgi:hypothetical protein
LDGALDHFSGRAIVAQVDHLGARGLKDAPHDVDRCIVPVKERRRGDNSDVVGGLQEARHMLVLSHAGTLTA